MWQRLSLRSRINVLLALVLTLGLAANVARLVFEAGPRVQAEDQSVTRLAREFVETIVAGLNETADPEVRLTQIVGDLKRLRHVSITQQTEETAGAFADDSADGDEARGVPAWFAALIHPERTSVSVPISVRGKASALVITSIPNDEIAEIWDGIVTQIEVGSAVALALFVITMIVIGRALAPLDALARAMKKIEAGSYDVQIEPSGAPEFAAICTRLNHLAATLGTAVEEKRQLAERAVSLQDLEREEIARELHDEFGPYLFALRVHAGALMRLAKEPTPDPDGVRKHGSAILEQVHELQQFTRRILERLRPVGLAELGLREALGALQRLWNDSNPQIAIETTISPALGETGETAELTIYRVVQEALTNVFRHARATAVNVSIEPAERPMGPHGVRDYALVRVRDNGRGLKADQKFGLGLTGMRERILALGGTLTVASGEGGVTIEAMVPTQAL
ncbi:MAG TPA: sensor histidine kinase [Bradyrhizobium sp.]|uniref:sensor histidine kinase n=1 Tax=Bradyrhizobium sp. TaxID=376 RepID=UPI002D80EB2E|nr:sensor histidine kinase [Bradyrhizobium sp.]HET7889340.1 sensor histidine kinase [Bradyrhizobium sp.]